MDSISHVIDMARYCDMGRSPTELLTDWLSGVEVPPFSENAGRTVVFTQSGRAAVALAAQHWNIGPGDEVLVPAYHCGSEVSPLMATGAKVTMYRVDSNARIDFNDILHRVTPRTRLIHVIHYFGWPTDIDELVRYCREKGIRLLEDCALSLFSKGIGEMGDAAIFSLRKSLPVCDGGILTLRDMDSSKYLRIHARSRSQAFKGLLSLVKKWLLRALRFPSVRRQQKYFSGSTGSVGLPALPASYYWTASSLVARPSRFSLGFLKRTVPSQIVRQRRHNYLYLRQCLDGTLGIKFLWGDPTVPEGVCPLGLPVLVDDRQQWCDVLNGAGVMVSPWWEGCHRGLTWDEFPEARALKSKLLLLPIHQQLNTSDLDYIANLVRSLAAQTTSRTR